jgi:hypothetical protein
MLPARLTLFGAMNRRIVKNINLIRLLALVLVLAGCGFNASATMNYVDYTVANAQTGSGSGYADLEAFNVDFENSAYNGVLAGGIVINQPDTSADPNNPAMPQTYVTVCTDFEGSLYLGHTYKYSASASPFSGLKGIDPTWNYPSLAIQNAAKLFYTYGNLSSGGIDGGNQNATGSTLENMAALQLAVWMVLYDTGSNGKVLMNNGQLLSSDEFYISTAGNAGKDTGAITEALGWVATLNGNYDYAGYLLQPDPTNSAQGNPNGHVPQELLMANPSVPEPATVFAGALLLLPLGASTIRTLRKYRNIKKNV